MNVGLILRSVHQTINSIVPKILTTGIVQNVLVHRIHYICDRQKYSLNSDFSPYTSSFLQPVLPIHNSVCSLKTKGRLQLRCKDCYFVCRQERWYVMCKTHPRHKQVKMKKRDYKTWILTSASQKPIRGW
ncbi:hypothetical protein ACFW04_008125 [Cataglyphis niger]